MFTNRNHSKPHIFVRISGRCTYEIDGLRYCTTGDEAPQNILVYGPSKS